MHHGQRGCHRENNPERGERREQAKRKRELAKLDKRTAKDQKRAAKKAENSADVVGTVAIVAPATAAGRARVLMMQRRLAEALELLCAALRVAPDLDYFEEMGRRGYRLAADHRLERAQRAVGGAVAGQGRVRQGTGLGHDPGHPVPHEFREQAAQRQRDHPSDAVAHQDDGPAGCPRFDDRLSRLLDQGHELALHGYMHEEDSPARGWLDSFEELRGDYPDFPRDVAVLGERN